MYLHAGPHRRPGADFLQDPEEVGFAKAAVLRSAVGACTEEAGRLGLAGRGGHGMAS